MSQSVDHGTETLVANTLSGQVVTMARPPHQRLFNAAVPMKPSISDEGQRNKPWPSYQPKVPVVVGLQDIVVSTHSNGTCAYHRVNQKHNGEDIPSPFVAHSAPLTCAASLTSKSVATGSLDGRMKIWSLATNNHGTYHVHQKAEFTCRSSVTALSAVGDVVLVGDRLGHVYLLRPQTGPTHGPEGEDSS